MKKLLVFLVLNILATNLYAKRVISLENGTCWLENFEKGGWKIASFSKKHAFFIFKEDLVQFEEEFSQYMEKFGRGKGQIESYQVFLHCGAYGSRILINMNSSNNSFCVDSWMGAESGKLESYKVNSNSADQEGACLGNIPGDLILTFADNNQLENTIEVLSSKRYKKLIFYVDKISELNLQIKLHRSYFYRESDVKNFLLKEEALQGLIKSIDFNYLNLPIGSAFQLWF